MHAVHGGLTHVTVELTVSAPFLCIIRIFKFPEELRALNAELSVSPLLSGYSSFGKYVTQGEDLANHSRRGSAN